MNSLELYDSFETYYEGRGNAASTESREKDRDRGDRQAKKNKPLVPRQVGNQGVEHDHAGRGGAQA